MSRTKDQWWDEINSREEDDRADEQASLAEARYQSQHAADEVCNFIGDQFYWFAEQLVEADEDIAGKLIAAVDAALKDKHYRALTEITKTSETAGTHLQGHIYGRSFSDLCKVFGAPHWRWTPHIFDENKTDVEWGFKFPDGRIFTVYNWKDGKAYNGDSGLSVDDIKEWNIGGLTSSVAWDVNDLLNIKLGMMTNAKK